MAYPEIYNSAGIRLAVLNNITSNSLTRRVNNKYLFEFKCFEEVFKTEYITFDNLVKIDNDKFNISYVKVGNSSSGKPEYTVKCEHVSYELSNEEHELESYAFTGTPTAILTDLLAGTDFSVGTVDFTSSVVFAVNKKASKRAIIMALANTLGGEIGFSDEGYTINLLNSIGQDNGYQLRIKKNLQQIEKVLDRRGVDKTTYAFEVLNIFQSDEFIADGLEDLESVDIGDTIQVIDETIDINVTQSVLEIQKDVIKNKKINIVTSNSWDSISDEFSYIAEDVTEDINNLRDRAIKNDEVYYGVKINNDVGIEIERDDKLARTKLNADDFSMEQGDGAGNYVPVLFFNTSESKWEFGGVVNTADLLVNGRMEIDGGGSTTGILFKDTSGESTVSVGLYQFGEYLAIAFGDGLKVFGDVEANDFFMKENGVMTFESGGLAPNVTIEHDNSSQSIYINGNLKVSGNITGNVG